MPVNFCMPSPSAAFWPSCSLAAIGSSDPGQVKSRSWRLRYFFVKALFGYWVIMWIKYTLLRIRIDHMLAFNWKFLTPFGFGAVDGHRVDECKLLAREPSLVYVVGHVPVERRPWLGRAGDPALGLQPQGTRKVDRSKAGPRCS